MSRLRADRLVNRAATGAPELTYGATVPSGPLLVGGGSTTGTANQPLQVTGTSYFSGNIGIGSTNPTRLIHAVGNAATNQLLGGISVAVSNTTGYGAYHGLNALSIPSGRDYRIVSTGTSEPTGVGKFSVYDVTANADRLVIDGSGNTGIGTTSPTSTFQVTGGESRFSGVLETVAAATTYNSGNNLVLELDVRNATTYTYTIPTGANIGVVSFKNMPASVQGGTTITCIFTQNAAGTGNTTGTTGIGTNCTVIGYASGAPVAGISTRALVGSGTTVTLSSTASDRDFVSFFVHYTGGTNTTATSYQVYATKNGAFRQGNVGV